MLPDSSTLAPPGRVLGPLVLAAIFEIVAWALALRPGALAAGWYGNPGLLVVAHTLTLGVLALSISGAGWQMVPVITTRPWPTPVAVGVNGGLVFGAVLLLLGFGPLGALAPVGAGFVAAALAVRAVVVGLALARASGRRVLRGWLLAAEVSLLAGLVLGLLLVAGRAGHPVLADPVGGVGRHLSLLLGGWVGGWIVGVGALLLPMFSVGPDPDARGLGIAAVAWFGGLWLGLPWLWALGALLAGGLLLATLARGLRRGPPMVQVGTGLVGLAGAAVFAGLGGLAADREALVFAALVLGVLPVLRGVAQRIVPFFAWNHVYGARLRGAPPVASFLSEGMARAQAALSLSGGALLVGSRLGWGEGMGRVAAALLLAGALVQVVLLARALGLAALGQIRGQALAGTEG